MIIAKRKNEYSTLNIELVDDDRILCIDQVGEDYLISCRYVNYRTVEEMDFLIQRDTEEIYQSFLKLYESIITGNVLGINRTDKSEYCIVGTTLYKNIVSEGVITIISDNTPLNCPNILKISNTEEGILLNFLKKDGKDYCVPKLPFNISIEIRQSGSRLYEFSNTFKILFRDLGRIEESTKRRVDEVKTFVNRPRKDTKN